MKANELRIGNFVEHEDPNEMVEGIHYHNDNDYRVLIGSYLRPIEDLKPIPLTEEWLKRFGFAFDGQCSHWFEDQHKAIELVKDVMDIGYSVYCSQGYSLCDYELTNVHQLQNLYFALTNTELTIKEAVAN